MDVLRYLLVLILASCCAGCQIGYIIKSGYYQADLLWRREPLEEILKRPELNTEIKRKLNLAVEAKKFAQENVGLKFSKNYTSYVALEDKFVTYAVMAAPAFELKSYTWWFPITGSVPYKGFFKKQDALDEEANLKEKGYDTFVRGVSAYSTLGWFNDPILSSMMNYKDFDLVNTIIHETVHTTIYIKNAADFNERLATFIGNKATELFYISREGKNSETLKKIKEDNFDDQLFSDFISLEIKSLEDFYKGKQDISVEDKLSKLEKIKSRFQKELLPKLKGQNYKGFSNLKLNNALLISYRTYMQDLSDFEKLYLKLGENIKTFVNTCLEFENEEDPLAALKKKI